MPLRLCVADVSRSERPAFSTVKETLEAAPTDVLVDHTSAAAVKGQCVIRATTEGDS